MTCLLCTGNIKYITHVYSLVPNPYYLPYSIFLSSQTDVIVNTISSLNLERGEISKALLTKAGPEMQREMGTASHDGKVISTKGYKLHCKEVYHTCCFESRKSKKLEVQYVTVGV